MELLFCCSCSKLVPLVWTVQTRTCGSNPLPCGMSGMSMCRACRNIRWKECILTMCMINWKMFFRVHSEFCVRSMYVNRFLTILSIYLLYLLTWHGWMKKPRHQQISTNQPRKTWCFPEMCCNWPWCQGQSQSLPSDDWRSMVKKLDEDLMVRWWEPVMPKMACWSITYSGWLQNPAPVDWWFFPLFIGFQSSRVLQAGFLPTTVWGF